MAITKQQAIKELQTRESFYVAYSQFTKLPYVVCDEESFNDQVRVFASEEQIKAYGQELLKEKILIMGMRYNRADYTKFYGLLYSLGVNSVVWTDGDDSLEVELTDIAKRADMSKLEESKRPLYNESFQLSAIYFMQELRRPLKKEERTVNLRELEEEVLANLRRSEFLMVMDVDPKDPSKMNLPYLKNKEEQILQPVFSDVIEMGKFTRGKKLRIAKIPFVKLPEVLMEKAYAFTFNPMGVNLVLTKDQMTRIIG